MAAKKRTPSRKNARRSNRAAPRPDGIPAIPRQLVEYLLLGQTLRVQPERYCQDGGIVLDVWLAFAKDLRRPEQVLIVPSDVASTVQLGSALHHALRAYRAARREKRGPPNISPLESYVAATVYLDELLRVVLPLTEWWRDTNLASLSREGRAGGRLRRFLQRAIEIKLDSRQKVSLTELRLEMAKFDDPSAPASRPRNWKVIDAAPLAALVGLFGAAFKDPAFVPDDLREADPAVAPLAISRRSHGAFADWLGASSAEIARAALDELTARVPDGVFERARRIARAGDQQDGAGWRPTIIQRVFLNRRAHLAEAGISTIKADAAVRLFNVSCKDITWGIIDAGIATHHPAFDDHRAGPLRKGAERRPSRVKKTFDLSLIDQIRNFDLIDATEAEKRAIVEKLWELRTPSDDAAAARKQKESFQRIAAANLDKIASQLENEMQPDWALIEPLIQLDGDDGSRLASDHGTHVAGILGADWRELRRAERTQSKVEEHVVLQGVCPDINLYDFRVLVPGELEATELAMVAALELIQYLNQRAGRIQPVHGVNISMSIPHEVKNYGCGATPVCVACDRLVASGVVVVAAAGNRGWDEQELGFGNFAFCSITDPGNAQHVITVGATHSAKPHTYGVSYFSSRGPTGDGRLKPDLVAPGEKIRGPIRGGADSDLDGTSMAAPFVSGAAAMLLSRHRELIGNAARVKEILLATATDLGREKYFQGHGMVDVLRALQSI